MTRAEINECIFKNTLSRSRHVHELWHIDKLEKCQVWEIWSYRPSSKAESN